MAPVEVHQRHFGGSESSRYAYRTSFQVTALPLCGGMMLPFAIGAVVDG
jgi:hypothetical protein